MRQYVESLWCLGLYLYLAKSVPAWAWGLQVIRTDGIQQLCTDLGASPSLPFSIDADRFGLRLEPLCAPNLRGGIGVFNPVGAQALRHLTQ